MLSSSARLPLGVSKAEEEGDWFDGSGNDSVVPLGLRGTVAVVGAVALMGVKGSRGEAAAGMGGVSVTVIIRNSHKTMISFVNGIIRSAFT